MIFRFDDSSDVDDNVGNLQPNQLTVDNLTIDSLRQRIGDLENSVKECLEKQQKIQEENKERLSSSSNSPGSSANNSTNTANANGSNNNLKSSKFNRELSTLKCQERQMTKLIDIIKTALNEVSCEELPNGCDDLGVEIENNNNDKSNEPPSVSII